MGITDYCELIDLVKAEKLTTVNPKILEWLGYTESVMNDLMLAEIVKE